MNIKASQIAGDIIDMIIQEDRPLKHKFIFISLLEKYPNEKKSDITYCVNNASKFNSNLKIYKSPLKDQYIYYIDKFSSDAAKEFRKIKDEYYDKKASETETEYYRKMFKSKVWGTLIAIKGKNFYGIVKEGQMKQVISSRLLSLLVNGIVSYIPVWIFTDRFWDLLSEYRKDIPQEAKNLEEQLYQLSNELSSLNKLIHDGKITWVEYHRLENELLERTKEIWEIRSDILTDFFDNSDKKYNQIAGYLKFSGQFVVISLEFPDSKNKIKLCIRKNLLDEFFRGHRRNVPVNFVEEYEPISTTKKVMKKQTKKAEEILSQLREQREKLKKLDLEYNHIKEPERKIEQWEDKLTKLMFLDNKEVVKEFSKVITKLKNRIVEYKKLIKAEEELGFEEQVARHQTRLNNSKKELEELEHLWNNWQLSEVNPAYIDYLTVEFLKSHTSIPLRIEQLKRQIDQAKTQIKESPNLEKEYKQEKSHIERKIEILNSEYEKVEKAREKSRKILRRFNDD